jgi:aminodeoxyfutalosine synthase
MTLNDLETIVAGGHALTRAQAERVLESADLAAVGMLGEAARRARTGDLVTFGRVAILDRTGTPADMGRAGEIRLDGPPESFDQARERVRTAATIANGVPLTGFSLADLVTLAGRGPAALETAARTLAGHGLTAVAEVPVDAFDTADDLIAAVQAARAGGLGVWRATVHRADMAGRLDLIERVVRLQQATGQLRAFAPLPRVDPTEEPSTGFDDVRTVAIARVMAVSVPVIQVDWPLYGPKLAQVAITFGAGDVDAIAPVDDPALGPRRAAVAEIERQIRAAAAVPAERDGRFELRA